MNTVTSIPMKYKVPDGALPSGNEYVLRCINCHSQFNIPIRECKVSPVVENEVYCYDCFIEMHEKTVDKLNKLLGFNFKSSDLHDNEGE